jgi:hypothetical protein
MPLYRAYGLTIDSALELPELVAMGMLSQERLDAIIDRTRVLTASQIGGVQLGENIVMDVEVHAQRPQ